MCIYSLVETGNPTTRLDTMLAVLAAVDKATAMKLVTMRLPIPLVEALKAIAEHHGIGYQPMVRDLLPRFALSEYRVMQQEVEAQLVATKQADDTHPVTDFMERKRLAACG